MKHVRDSMEFAIHMGVGVRECLILTTIWEFGLASEKNISQSLLQKGINVHSILNILRKKDLVIQEGVIDTLRPRPVGRPTTVKLWSVSGPARLKIIEWQAGKRQAPPAARERG